MLSPCGLTLLFQRLLLRLFCFLYTQYTCNDRTFTIIKRTWDLGHWNRWNEQEGIAASIASRLTIIATYYIFNIKP